MTSYAPNKPNTFRHANALKIYGPPGSGKTRELVRILQEHVADGDFQLGEGIIVSFTRAAAHDIARRVNPEGEPGRYHCTLHALCKRYYGFDGTLAEAKLKEFFGERHIEYRPSRSPDPEEWATSANETKSEGALITALWSYARNKLISIEDALRLMPPAPEVSRWWVGDRMLRLYAEYEDWKRENRLFDFTDMLEYAVRNPPSMPFAFFALDEAQDCSPLQWAVAQAFAANADVVYIAGDEDQCLYSWMGSSPSEFLEAEVSDSDILRVNHRSGSSIVSRAQAFIRRNRQRQDKDTIAARNGGEVSSTIDLPSLEPGRSMFVMARAHYLNSPVMDELERMGYPFEDKRGQRGVGGKGAVAYQRFVALRRGTLSLDELRRLYDVIPSKGPWLAYGAKKRLNDMDADHRRSRLVRLTDLTDYGATDELVNAIREGAIDPLGRVDKGQLGYLRRVEEAHGVAFLDARKAAESCSVGPIHAFKGLEADDVLLLSGMPPAAARDAVADAEAERRVFYVGMTRPKERLFHLYRPAFMQWEGLL